MSFCLKKVNYFWLLVIVEIPDPNLSVSENWSFSKFEVNVSGFLNYKQFLIFLIITLKVKTPDIMLLFLSMIGRGLTLDLG